MIDRQALEIVEIKGRSWGWQWRRNFGDKFKVSLTSMQTAIESDHSGSQHFPEVFCGDGLEFACALKHIPEKHREFAKIHYIIPQPAKVKAAELGIHINTYFQRRNAMRRVLAALIA